MTDIAYSIDVEISFGHCDPAAIVYYPNYFRWFDRCFHSFLQARAGGHSALCDRLGAVGLGLMDVGARFPAPAREGDMMRLEMSFAGWGARALRLGYVGRVGDRTVIEGHEVRGLFVRDGGRLRAGQLAPVRALLDP